MDNSNISKNNSDESEDLIKASNLAKNRQYKNAILITFIVISLATLILSLLYWPSNKASNKVIKKAEPSHKIKHPVDKDKVKLQWQENLSNKVDDDIAKTQVLSDELTQLKNINQTQQSILKSQSDEIKALKEQFFLLQKETSLPNGYSDNHNSSIAEEEFSNDEMQIDTTKLVSNKNAFRLPKTAENYVPAGSFVEGILLGGLDAHAGVNAQSDPHPVLIRVLNDGVLPNNRRSQLTNCRIIGAGYGDISSERAFIRLERMSCEQEGYFTDYPVYGYVTGPDGKDGIRGKVVMRDGAIVTRAFIGGFLGGLSDVASQSLTTQSISPLGSVETIKGNDALAYSGTNGVGDAMELYARYNIKRAELYQPVIEIPAGTKINVVFNRGFYLDGMSESDPARLSSSKTHADFLIEKEQGNVSNVQDIFVK